MRCDSGSTVRSSSSTAATVVIPSRLEPGQSGRVEYRGSNWSARNAGERAIEAGREAVITQVDGLTLHVKAE